MTNDRTFNTISRRSAIAGLGVGGLGVAFVSARPAAAQDAAETASHPVVGFWLNAVTGPGSDISPWTLCIFHADGTFVGWNGLNAGAALGIWRPTGERAADLLFVFLDTDPTTATETPGTATF